MFCMKVTDLQGRGDKDVKKKAIDSRCEAQLFPAERVGLFLPGSCRCTLLTDRLYKQNDLLVPQKMSYNHVVETRLPLT